MNNVHTDFYMNVHNGKKTENNTDVHHLPSKDMNKVQYICIMNITQQ